MCVCVCVCVQPAAASQEAAASRSRSCQCCCPARYPPVLATASSGACVCVGELRSSALHLPRVQGTTAPRVRQCSQRDVQGVCLRDHDADVLVYDISVITSCRNFRASVALSRWVLCGPSLLDWSDAFLFSMQGGKS